MITTIKKEDLVEAINGNHDLYNVYSLLGDKLRVLYTALGWTHMVKEFEDADRIIEELTYGVFGALQDGEENVVHATAGLEVSGYFDEEGMLNLEYSFNLV